MLASSPWYASPLAGFTFAVGGFVVGVIGCLLTLWLARSRRSLRYALISQTALLASKISAGEELDIRLRGDDQPIADPHVTVIRLRCQSRVDIRPGDFIDGVPIALDVGATIVKPLGDLPAGLKTSVDGATLQIAPSLIRAGSRHTMSVLTEGAVQQLSLRSQLADVRVRQESPDAGRWATAWGGAIAGLATGVAASFATAGSSRGTATYLILAVCVVLLVMAIVLAVVGRGGPRRSPE